MKKLVCLTISACGFLLAAQSQRLTAQEAAGKTADAVISNATGNYVVFDPPEECPLSNDQYCIAVSGIDAQRTVAGSFTDASSLMRSFYRVAGASAVSFDPPGSHCTYYLFCSTVNGMNAAGYMVGSYYTGSALTGFLRDPHANFTDISVPGAVFGTEPQAINSAGVITGSYADAAGLAHGFVRDAEGNYTTFDALPSTYTVAESINSQGDVGGYYYDASTGSEYVFVRSADGHVSVLGGEPGVEGYLDDAGRVLIQDNITSSWYLYQSGTYTEINFPGSSYTTRLAATDGNGAILGAYQTEPPPGSVHFFHGFYWLPNGTYASFDPPGSANTLSGLGGAMNEKGDIAGSFLDASGNGYLFIRVAE